MAQHAFKYYNKDFHIPEKDCIEGIEPGKDGKDKSKFLKDIQQLEKYDRVWIILSHIYPDEKEYFLKNLKQSGQIANIMEAKGAYAYLVVFKKHHHPI